VKNIHYITAFCFILLTLIDQVNHVKYKPIITKDNIITKVHNIISFNQSAWMKPYIMGNNALRKDAKHDFEKDFFKLMNTSVFGKTMENVKHRIELKLTTDPKMAIKQFSRLDYKTKLNIYMGYI
jgi:hypothetical protein